MVRWSWWSFFLDHRSTVPYRNLMKKHSERRKHCALAVVRRSQKLSSRRQNLISLRWSLPLPTKPVWWGSMHAISSYRGNRPTNKQTNKHSHKPTNRLDRLQYTAPLSLARSVITTNSWLRRLCRYIFSFFHYSVLRVRFYNKIK